MPLSEYWTRIQAKYHRTGAEWIYRRLLPLTHPRAVISFTFDDFPRTALSIGGPILQQYGFCGTYYASFGLMGSHEPSGPIFSADDLDGLTAAGHELGCHTFHHCHSWETSPAVFEASLVKNRDARKSLVPGVEAESFSYPICSPRMKTKRITGRHFSSCRGGGQKINVGAADLNYLAAFFLEKCRDNPDSVRRMIDRTVLERGWLIFATHDVCPEPSPYGCSPWFFEQIVRHAAEAGADVLPVGRAVKLLRGSCQPGTCS